MRATLHIPRWQEQLEEISIIFPFILIVVSEILLVSYSGISGVIKIFSVGYMATFSVLRGRFHYSYLIALAIFLPFFLYGIATSFNLIAALREGIRYLFPVVILLYGYAIKDKGPMLITFFIGFVAINDFYQIINYINWIRGVNQWFYYYSDWGGRYYNASSGIIRATGFVVHFGLFGFINLIAFFLTKKYYFGKHRTFLLVLFVIGLFASFSYKSIGTFFIVLLLQFKSKLQFIVVISVLALTAYASAPDLILSMKESFTYRMKEYVYDGDSARAESYRVMFDEVKSANLLGEGVGAFGGPSSTEYKSPYYKKVDFNWYYTPHLKTTDTFYPHLFVEVGILGGLAYLFLLLSPLFFGLWDRSKLAMVCILYFAIFLDSTFSYALNNIAFPLMSLLLVYPINFSEPNLKLYALTSVQTQKP